MAASLDPSPRVVGRYRVCGELASGGMATVHLGRRLGDGGTAAVVAIKRLHRHLAKNVEVVAMFLEEAKLAARIRHLNVGQVLEVVREADELLLVLEYIHGESLSRALASAALLGKHVPPRVVAALLRDVLAGLDAAHSATDERGRSLELVHRDVSPHNIMVGADGVARVVDFGIAKAVGRGYTTRDGSIKGKLAYMAPEQLVGVVSASIDLHAAAVVMWEALTGEPLHAGENDAVIMSRVLHAPIAPPSSIRPDLPPAFDALLVRALARDPDERFPDARSMRAAVEACGGYATPEEVSAWLEEVASPALSHRAALVREVLEDTSDGLGAAPPQSDSALADGSATLPARADRSRRRRALAAASLGVTLVVLTMLAVASPLVGRATRTPASGAAVVAETSSPAVAVMRGSDTPTSDVAGRGSAPAPLEARPPPPPSGRMGSSPTTPVPRPRRATHKCSPPYRIGEQGEKLWISECL